MRVVTNNRCVAEQKTSDKVENVATGGVNIGEVGKVGEIGIVQEHRDGWSQNWKSKFRRIPNTTRRRQFMKKKTLRRLIIKVKWAAQRVE